MKKTFELRHPKKTLERLIEGVKGDVRKYMKRERKKQLPDGVDFWDFDCRFGATLEDAKVIHPAEIIDYISKAEKEDFETVYIELLSKPGVRQKKAKKEEPKSKPIQL